MSTADAPKTATKRRKPAAEGTAKPAAKAKTTSKASAAPGPVSVSTPSHEEISRLAEQFWIERGRPHGSPEHDWQRAEEQLRGKAS